LSISVELASFEDWWEPFELGVGPAGQLLAGLDDPTRRLIRAEAHQALSSFPATLDAIAWAARGVST
jgi:hypothetical protein